jgi:hypothetical protein
MIAVYFIMKSIGLTNSNIGLILVYSGSSGLGYLIAKGFFDTVPRSMREAAYIEGASEFMVFWKIVIPLSKPIIVYTVISTFLMPWMDFIFANIMLNSGLSENKTVAIGLYAMVDKVRINNYFGEFCAGGVLVSIPISILVRDQQKFYIEGVTGGSVKGERRRPRRLKARFKATGKPGGLETRSGRRDFFKHCITGARLRVRSQTCTCPTGKILLYYYKRRRYGSRFVRRVGRKRPWQR